MHLFIFQDGEVKKSPYELTENDKDACDSGYVDIIDIRDPAKPKIYYNGEWQDIEEAEDTYTED